MASCPPSSALRFLRRKAHSIAQAVGHKAGPIAASFSDELAVRMLSFPPRGVEER